MKTNYQFVVTSDLHADWENRRSDKQQQFDALHKKLTELNPKPEALVLCGDLTNDSRKEEIEDVFGLVAKIEVSGIPVCEGWGNHDVVHKNVGLNNDSVQKRIIRRNEAGRVKLPNFSKFKKDDGKYCHYKWWVELDIPEGVVVGDKKKVKIHFFMLNNVPGYGVLYDDNIGYSEKYERNPDYSLDYLQEELTKIDKDDFYILLFHTNFHCETIDPKTPDRWWPADRKQDFYNVVKNPNVKAHYITSFFGHKHSYSGDKKYKMVEEELEVANDSHSSIYGYLCRCTGADGAKYFSTVGIGVVEQASKGCLALTITTHAVDKSTSAEMYLLEHNGEGKQVKTAKSVTLNFDLVTGAELKRTIVK